MKRPLLLLPLLALAAVLLVRSLADRPWGIFKRGPRPFAAEGRDLDDLDFTETVLREDGVLQSRGARLRNWTDDERKLFQEWMDDMKNPASPWGHADDDYPEYRLVGRRVFARFSPHMTFLSTSGRLAISRAPTDLDRVVLEMLRSKLSAEPEPHAENAEPRPRAEAAEGAV